MENRTNNKGVINTKGILRRNSFDVILVKNYNARERTGIFKYSKEMYDRSEKDTLYYFSCSYPQQE